MIIKRLQRFVEVLRRRRSAMLCTLAIGFVGAALVVAFLPKSYQAAAQVLIVNDRDGRDPSVSSIDLPSVATSTVVLEGVRRELKLTESLIDLKNHVKARVSSRSSIMEISYRDKSPDRAVAIPNALADELARYYEQIATGRADEGVRKLDTAIAVARERLRVMNRRLGDEAARHPFLNSDQALETLTARIDTLTEQQELAKAQLQNDIALAHTISPDRGLKSKIVRHEILFSDPYYTRLTDGVARDRATLTFERAQYRDRFPGVHALATKVTAEKSALRAETARLLASPNSFSQSAAEQAQALRKADAVVTGDQARIKALNALTTTERRRLEALPRANAAAIWLRIQRDAAQSDYLTLSSRRATALANRAEALSLGSVVVVDRAVKAETAKVGLGRTLLSVVMLAFVVALAITMAMLLEALDIRLLRGDQFEKLYRAPLIVTFGREA